MHLLACQAISKFIGIVRRAWQGAAAAAAAISTDRHSQPPSRRLMWRFAEVRPFRSFQLEVIMAGNLITISGISGCAVETMTDSQQHQNEPASSATAVATAIS